VSPQIPSLHVLTVKPHHEVARMTNADPEAEWRGGLADWTIEHLRNHWPLGRQASGFVVQGGSLDFQPEPASAWGEKHYIQRLENSVSLSRRMYTREQMRQQCIRARRRTRKL
jgi:hypothetical protein